MYSSVLMLHSWVRWVALVLGVVTTMAALVDRGAKAPGSPGAKSAADRLGLFFMIVLDIQVLLGLLLYVALSPATALAFKDFGAAMRDPALRFWAVEHAATMLLAAILTHAGRVLARSARTPGSKRTRQIVCFGLATLAMIARTPWPGMAVNRPLFRV
jgi:hypothetical protein